VAIEVYLFAVLVAALVFGNIILRFFGRKLVTIAFNSGVLLLLILLAILLGHDSTVYLNVFSISPFSTFFFVISASGILLVNFIAYARSQDYFDFALLSSFALAGMLIVVSATSLVSIFLGLELINIPSVFIVLLSRKNGLEPAIKLFIMGSVAIALFSFAAVLVYGAANTLLLEQQQQNSLLLFALILFITSLGFEASVFPFSILIPDIHQGAGAHATAMIGGVNDRIGFAALVQILVLVFVTSDFAFLVVATLSVLTILYGNIVALVQDNLKRMLAYSSISQVGYLLMGVAVRGSEGVSASLFQAFAYTFLFIGTMSIVAWLESKGKKEITDLIGLYKENRFCAIALAIFLMSMIGIPLTTGFVGKFLILFSVVDGGATFVAVLGIAGTVISVFYYAKVISAIYTNKLGARRMQVDKPTLLVVCVCVAITVLFGIYPQPILDITNSAAQFLFRGLRV